MTSTDAELLMLERLQAVDWEQHDLRTLSRMRLLQEYLRRAAQWAVAVGCESEWPFFDIARCLDPAIRADPELVHRLEDHLASNGAQWYARKIGPPSMLHWAALRSRPDVSL